MAQINTVTGIDQLNTTVQGLSSQFMQLQAVQGASLVGRDVIVPGNTLSIDDTTAVGQGGFELTGAAGRGEDRHPVAERRGPADAQPRRRERRRAQLRLAGRQRDERERPHLPRQRHRRRRGDDGDGADARPRRRDQRSAARRSTSSSRTRGPCPTARSRHSTEPFPTAASAAPLKEHRHGFPARSVRTQRLEQEPRGHRQQHRQREHLRRQGVAGRVRRHLRQHARRQPELGRHRRLGRRGRAAVQPRHDHRDRQPARRRDQRQRLLRDERSERRDFVFPQRPVQARPHRLHRQRPEPEADGLCRRRERQRHRRRGGAAADAHRGHHPGRDDQGRHGAQPRLAPRRDGAGRGRADRLLRSDDLQQRDLADGLRRQGSVGRADVLLPEVGDRHVERLRHGQRHADQDLGRQPCGLHDDHLPDQRRHADRAGRHRLARHSLGDQTPPARSPCRSAASP